MKKIIGLMVLAGMFCASPAVAQESLCATVEIEIQQELTLERQAFDAKMKINNGLDGIDLEDVSITINFTDEGGTNVLTATVDELNTNTNALFFVQDPTLKNIDSATNGTINGGTSAEINWLLIPAYGAADDNPQGTMYYVGATLTYTLQGKEETVEVSPDYIFVKPMPYLELDYFLPGDVYGDDAFTPEVEEPPIPFPVGLRILNSGYGGVGNVRIDSGQPEIVTNELGLLVDFAVNGSAVHGEPRTPSLLMDFGDFESLESKMGYWEMESSLSGTFTNFTATISHSDELGGLVTSLINPTNVRTHIHIKDVVVDLPDRDRVVDFLTTSMVYESEDGLDSPLSYCTNAYQESSTAASTTFHLNSSSNGLVYGRCGNDARGESMKLKEVVRSDGKRMLESNAWLSKEHENGGTNWLYYFNLFDVDGASYSYSVVYEDASAGNNAPVVYYIGPKTAYVGTNITFHVMASDPDGTVPSLTMDYPLVGASFTMNTNFEDLAVGLFSWTPNSGQTGSHTPKFTASDGQLSDSENVSMMVVSGTPPPEPDYPAWWLERGLIDTNATPSDYAAVNVGQLKHTASMAWDEFNLLPVGAPALTLSSSNDFTAANIGQVKAVSAPFYDRLGMTNDYPWSGSSNASSDFAIANIGQVKHVFSFEPHKDSDSDGMPDWWESNYTNNATAMEAFGNSDNDEHSNLYEYLHNTDPNVAD